MNISNLQKKKKIKSDIIAKLKKVIKDTANHCNFIVVLKKGTVQEGSVMLPTLG